MAMREDRPYTQDMPQPDLAHLARDLTRIHDAVITGGSPPVQPRALVKRSWDRMLRLGLDPAGRAIGGSSPPRRMSRHAGSGRSCA
jgi:hypothetical protein